MLVAAFGLLITLAWHAHWIGVLQPAPGATPPVYLTGVAFAVLGASVIALGTGHRGWVRLGSGLALALATAEAVEISFDVSPVSGLFPHYIVIAGESPGHMAPNTLAAFGVSGLVLLIASVGRLRRWQQTLLVIGGCWTATIGILAVFGYVTGISAVYQVGGLTRMAVQTAVAFTVLGAGITATAWLPGPREEMPSRRLIGVPAAVGVLALSLMSWHGLSVAIGRSATVSADAASAAVLVLAVIVAAAVATLLVISGVARSRRDEAQSLQRQLVAETEQLRRSEDRARRIIESTPDALLIVDDTGGIVFVNGQAEALFGYPADELVGQPVEAVVPQQLRARHVRNRTDYFNDPKVRSMGTGLELHARRKDGQLVAVEISLSPIGIDGATAVAAAVRDISERKQAEQRLRGSEERYRALVDNAPVGVAMVDLDGTFLQVNERFCEITGYSHAEMLARTFQDITHPDDLDADLAEVGKLLAGQLNSYWLEKRYIRKDGALVWVLLAASAVRDERGDPVHFVAAVEDITRLKDAEASLRTSEERFRRVFDEAPIGMALVGLDRRFNRVNPRLAQMLAHTVEDLEGMPVAEVTHPDNVQDDSEGFRQLLAGEVDAYRTEKRYLRADGEPVWASLSAALIRDVNGAPLHFFGHILDISDRKRFERELQYLADHDHLTGLINRRRFEDELGREAARVRRHGGTSSVLLMDLDQFKDVNDNLGHHVGDQLLVRVGRICTDRLRSTDIAARLGGDEFAVLLPETGSEQAELVAWAVLGAIQERESVDLPSGVRHVTASIGISTADRSSETSAQQLLLEADIALYDAKEQGRNRAVVHSTTTQRKQRTRSHLSWADRISRAIEDDRLELHAQPIVSLNDDQAPWHELLLRMVDDHGELIPPTAFIYIAERYDLAERLDHWVLHNGTAILADQQRSQPDSRVSINISARSLADPSLADRVAGELNRADVNPRDLCIEVTETAAITNIQGAAHLTRQLNDLGCRIALDDFGSGFASFHYLKHLRMDYLKIDGEFVHRLAESPTNQLLVRSMADIAHGLGAQTIAEWVEDPNTMTLLRDYHIDYAQGFHIDRPTPTSRGDSTHRQASSHKQH